MWWGTQNHAVPVRCSKCGSEKITKRGRSGGKQRYRCKGCGSCFMGGQPFKSKHESGMVGMAVNLVKNGLSLAEARIRLASIYGDTVSRQTIMAWCKKEGIIFSGKRLRPCRYCGSNSKHRRKCPVPT